MSQQTQDRSAQDLLVKLGDTNLVLSDSSKDIRERKVIDSDGNDIGHVSALFIDTIVWNVLGGLHPEIQRVLQ